MKIFLVESSDAVPPCPLCGGKLAYRDSRRRIFRHEGGIRSFLIIRRFRCCHCGRHHNELPDCLVPYKHYGSEVISGVLDGVVTPDDEDSEDYPCAETMNRWNTWHDHNRERIEGNLRNIMCRLHNRKSDFLLSGVSLLSMIKSRDVSPNWLGYILRVIYNNGGFLVPVW